MPEFTVRPNDIMIKFSGPEDRIVRVTDRVNDRRVGSDRKGYWKIVE